MQCTGGNIFTQALQDYSDLSGITIEIHYIEEYSGENDVFSQMYDQDSLPDLVLLNKHSQYDIMKRFELK